MCNLPGLTLVIGGAASGKSDFAESLVLSCGERRTYIATAQAFDSEMQAKIARHRATRADAGWVTLEEPKDVVGAIARAETGSVILLDCATLWLSNLLMANSDVGHETAELLDALSIHKDPVVIVSNETGQGIVPENKLARRFRQEQGLLNRRLAAQAGLVVQVTVGLPQVLKGRLPEGFA
ncbi:MAG: bifunctional adenosylcobinamide kinase/adenosylcobinamide-phosphate guanylyltransferase [Pseudomonadota bacterium]